MAFEGIRGDIAIYAEDELGRWWAAPGFWVAATHRLGARGHRAHNRPVRWAMLGLHCVLAFPWRTFKGVYIPASTRIGPGLRLPHPQNIVLAPGGEIGAECSIYQDVTIGRGSVAGVPKIGERVILYPGARVLGGVRVGDDARIGANAVVQRHVPPGAAVSVPRPRVIPAATAQRTRRRLAVVSG